MNGVDQDATARIKSEESTRLSQTVSPAQSRAETPAVNGTVQSSTSGDSGTAPGNSSLTPKSGALVAKDPNAQTDIRVGLVENTHRIDVEALMSKFRTMLGANWDRYRDALTHFLMGKLSRQELVHDLGASLGGEGLKMHNYLVLSLLANACRELPPGIESSFGGWTKGSGKSGKRNGVHATEGSVEDLHREILSLSVRERRRIKSISREHAVTVGGPPGTQPKRPAILPPPPNIIAIRQSLLPRIPYVSDRDRQAQAQAEGQAQAQQQADSQQSPPAPTAPAKPAPKGRKRKADAAAASAAPAPAGTTPDNSSGRQQSPQMLGGSATPTPASVAGMTVNESGNTVHPGRSSGPLTWTQDIIHGFDVPLASESYELPSDDTVGSRMLGIALEHGLLEGIDAGATDLMLVGLECYLQNMVQRMLGELKHRKITTQEPLGAADVDLFVQQHPTEVRDVSVPFYRMRSEGLRDEETVHPTKRRALDAVNAPIQLATNRIAIADTPTQGPITPPLSNEDVNMSSTSISELAEKPAGSLDSLEAGGLTDKQKAIVAAERCLAEHNEGSRLISSLIEG